MCQNVKRITPMNKKEEKLIWKKVKELRKKGLLPLPIAAEDRDEPTALENSQYRLNQNNDDKSRT